MHDYILAVLMAIIIFNFLGIISGKFMIKSTKEILVNNILDDVYEAKLQHETVFFY